MISEAAISALNDTDLSPAACRIVLYVLSLGPGQHEIKHSRFFALLNHPGEKAVRAALTLAVDCGYIRRTAGGKGRSDLYEFSPVPDAALKDSPALRADLSKDSSAEIASLKDSPAPTAHLNGFSPAPRADLNAPSSSTPTSPSSPPPTAGARPPDEDLSKLRDYLGSHAAAVDMMLGSADHSPLWVAAVMGKFGPAGTQIGRFGGIPPDRHPAVLATALMEWAETRKRYENRHFDGFVRKAATIERRGDGGGDDAGAEAGGATRRASVGAGDGRRWVTEG